MDSQLPMDAQTPKNQSWLSRSREKRINRWWLLPVFWAYVFWGECVVRATTAASNRPFFTDGLLLIALFSVVTALAMFGLCNLFSKKINRGIEMLFVIFLGVFFISQVIYYYKFHFFYTPYSMGNATQIVEFWRIILKAFWVKGIPILLLILPCVALSVFLCVFEEPLVSNWTVRLLLLSMAVVVHFGIVTILPLFGTDSAASPYQLYHATNNFSLASHRLGVLPSFRLDFHRILFGFNGGQLHNPNRPDWLADKIGRRDDFESASPDSTTPDEMDPDLQEPIWPVYPADEKLNMLHIPFDKISEETLDENIVNLNEYFSRQTPSAKNDKTGLFEGCNLIQITAEGFSYLAINPELTPTLYKLQTEGFNFTDFYTAYWGVSTSDGEYVSLTGTIPKSGTWSMSDTQDKAMPLTMAQQLKHLGYTANAYHNHTKTYYRRNKSHPNLGYQFKAVGMGLEVTDQWPESDVEMIDLSTADYVNHEPFHAYYMTVSGHLEYNLEDNAIARKNYELVKDLEYSEPVKCYLACQIELDRALELLLQRLEEAGVLENTVIVISADHYPYGLTEEQQSELAGHPIDTRFELYKNACIIYKTGMTPETIDVPCSSMDLLPTVSNLFGLDFDSRLYMGRDVFSDADPFVLFSDFSWRNEFGSFYSLDESVSSNMEEDLPPEVVKYYNELVADKFLVSQWILETDYWRVLFGDNLPPDEPVEVEIQE